MRVLGLPVPQVPTHRLQVFPRLEPELLLCESGVGREVRNVAGSVWRTTSALFSFEIREGGGGAEKEGGQSNAPSRGNLRLEVVPSRLAHRVDDIKHALASPTAEVVRLVASVERALEHPLVQLGGLVEGVEREPVAAREVHDVQIVADAGAVVRRVVVPKHLEGRVLYASDGHVGEQREEVAGSSFWFLADKARGVRPGWAVGVKDRYARSVTKTGRPRRRRRARQALT